MIHHDNKLHLISSNDNKIHRKNSVELYLNTLD